MSDDFSATREVKAARKHQCYLCLTHIEPGQTYIRWVGRFDGGFFSSAVHHACEAVYRANYERLDDGNGVVAGVFADAWSAAETVEAFRAAGVWDQAAPYLGHPEDALNA